MLEILLILFIYQTCVYMPLRGKQLEQLSPKQKQRVAKAYNKHMKSKKGRQMPDMTIEDFLPTLQKQGRASLIGAIVLFPIYILAIVFLYLPMV